MSIEDLYEEQTDWCASCGAEHGYMCGPCDECGNNTFTKKRPAPIVEKNPTNVWWVGEYMVTATYSCTCKEYRLKGNCKHIRQIIEDEGQRN